MGAMRQYARALIDGNLAEVALYAGNGPGAVFKGTDSHGNRCVCRAASLYHDGVTCVSVPSRRFPTAMISQGCTRKSVVGSA